MHVDVVVRLWTYAVDKFRIPHPLSPASVGGHRHYNDDLCAGPYYAPETPLLERLLD